MRFRWVVCSLGWFLLSGGAVFALQDSEICQQAIEIVRNHQPHTLNPRHYLGPEEKIPEIIRHRLEVYERLIRSAHLSGPLPSPFEAVIHLKRVRDVAIELGNRRFRVTYPKLDDALATPDYKGKPYWLHTDPQTKIDSILINPLYWDTDPELTYVISMTSQYVSKRMREEGVYLRMRRELSPTFRETLKQKANSENFSRPQLLRAMVSLVLNIRTTFEAYRHLASEGHPGIETYPWPMLDQSFRESGDSAITEFTIQALESQYDLDEYMARELLSLIHELGFSQAWKLAEVPAP